MESHLEILTPELLKELFERLQKYAIKHYEEDGWDIVVECCEYSDFVEDVTSHNIPLDWNAVFEYYRSSSKLVDERRREIEAEIF